MSNFVLLVVIVVFMLVFYAIASFVLMFVLMSVQTRPNGVSLPLLLHTKIDSKKTMTHKSARKATTPGTMLCT